MSQVNILLFRDHDGGSELIADYFDDPKWQTNFTYLILIASRIAAAGNKQGITRIVLIHDPAKTAYFVTMDDITNVGFTGEFQKGSIK